MAAPTPTPASHLKPAWDQDLTPYHPATHLTANQYRPLSLRTMGSVRKFATMRPGDATANHTLSPVSSFVPMPGEPQTRRPLCRAREPQTRRPRRKAGEIERIFKCGWGGCEKAYGTVNHLNNHLNVNQYGPKCTPAGRFTRPNFSSFVAGYHTLLNLPIHQATDTLSLTNLSPCIESKEILKEWRASKRAQGKPAEEEARWEDTTTTSSKAQPAKQEARWEDTTTTSSEAQPVVAGSPNVSGMPLQRQLLVAAAGWGIWWTN